MPDLLSSEELERLTRRSFIGRGAAALAGTSVAGALIAGCSSAVEEKQGSSSGKDGLEKVIHANIVPLDSSYAADLLAVQNGYFQKEGLQVEFQSTRGSAPAIQAALQGTILLTRAGAIETIRAISNEGAPLKNIATEIHKSALWFVSSKDEPLTKPSDWRGKKMGIPSEGGTSEQVLDLMLASGHVPLDSVERQVVGLSPGTFELVKQGRVAGYVIGSVNGVIFQQTKPDAYLFDTSRYVEDAQIYLTSDRQLKSNREQLAGYIRAVRRGATEILSDKERKFATTLKTLRAHYDFPELKDDKLAVAVLNTVTDSWVKNGEENLLKTVPDVWQKTYDQLVPLKLAKSGKDPKQWYTNEFSDAA
jgi:NitT/TauT family transport system substrate-binding protein